MERRSQRGGGPSEDLPSPVPGSQDSNQSRLSAEELSQLTALISRELALRPGFINEVRMQAGDPRNLETAQKALEVPEGYFGYDDTEYTTNAMVKHDSKMVSLKDFRDKCTDKSRPVEKQWFEFVAESCKTMGVKLPKVIAWLKFRLEPHMQQTVRNLEAKKETFNTIESLYNKVCVKFIPVLPLDEIEIELNRVEQQPDESWNDLLIRLGEVEQKLWECCGKSSIGQYKCSPEAQFVRMERAMDKKFAEFARLQSYRDSRPWPTTCEDLTALLNFYYPHYQREKKIPSSLYFTPEEKKKKEKPTEKKEKDKKDKGKAKTGDKAFSSKDKDKKEREVERSPEAQKQWDESSAKFKKLTVEELYKIREWHAGMRKCHKEEKEPTEELVKQAEAMKMCLKCRQYGHLKSECLQSNK